MNKLVGFVNNTNLINGHDGLAKIANQQLGINVKSLGRGEMIAFLNKKGDKVKLYAGGDVIAYLRHDRKIDPRVIQHLPRHFNGQAIRYDNAVRDMLKTRFPKWFESRG